VAWGLYISTAAEADIERYFTNPPEVAARIKAWVDNRPECDNLRLLGGRAIYEHYTDDGIKWQYMLYTYPNALVVVLAVRPPPQHPS
jgi:hypothetical protein